MDTLELLQTTDDVIDALGGNAEVGALCGRPAKVVWGWRKASRSRFPAETYIVITTALARTGKRAPAQLWGIAEAMDAA